MKRFLILIFCSLTLLSCQQKPKETNVITMWHWMTDRREALEELARQYKEIGRAHV